MRHSNWQGKSEILGGKPAPVPHFLPQIPHELPWNCIWASVVKSQELTTSAMAWPLESLWYLEEIGP